MRQVPTFAIVLLILSVFSFPTFLNQIVPPANAASASFSFAASGDMGSLTVSTSISNLNRLVTDSPNFFLGLGDFSYDPSVTGNTWCGQFKSSFNSIQILPGDHDTGGHNSANFGETHSYERYVNGCPLSPGVSLVCGPVAGNCYGKEYYFDYPATSPVARFIFASPKIYNMTGVCTSSPNCSSQTGQSCTDQYGCWPYASGDVHYNWVSNTIDGARATGIKWVIVATHKLCISASDATCSMGLGFFNMLVQKKVDLVIQAHDNAYERSKQIALNSTAGCSSIKTDGNGYALYNSGCVVDTGSRGFYTPGAGSVVVVQGAWDNDLYDVNASSPNPGNVAEAPYFAKLMGKNTPGNGLGFTKYTVSASRIDVQTNFSGSYSDSFSIWGGPNPVPSASWSPLSPQVGQTVTFTASASGGVPPYSFTWDFGDGGKATGTTASHGYASANYFNVTLTTIDSANNAGSSRSVIAVGSWNPNVPCVPSLTSLSSILGSAYPSQSLAGSQWQTNSTAGGIPNKRALSPPCTLTNINGRSMTTYVEVDNVYLTSSYRSEDCSTRYDAVNGGGNYGGSTFCDSTGNVFSVGTTNGFLHIEFDHDWMAKGFCGPGRSPCDNNTIVQDISNGAISLNIQGFVYWDPELPNPHWEIHPITGWKLSQTGVPTVTVNNPTPKPAGTGAAVSVTFAVSSSTSITGVSVNWGDGSTPDSLPGAATSDTHVYSSTGSSKTQTFTITVTATNSAGNGSGSTTETVNDRPPSVTISGVAPNPANTGATVNVNFSATDPDGTISSISVNWGDGSPPDNLPGTATSDAHSYASPGSFTMTVTATDNSGSTGQSTGSVTVQTPTAPIVTVSAPTPNPANTGATVTVTFTVSSSTKVTGIAVNWGDGTASDSLGGKVTSDTHTYASTGSATSQTFTITVTATNSAGPGSGTTSETVNDRPPTVTFIAVAPNPALTGSTVTLSFASTDPDGTVSSISIDWGDGTTPSGLPGTATSATHSYINTGNAKSQTFTITITSTDNGGSTGSATGTIAINDRPPTVNITNASPNPAATGQLVTLTFSTADPDGIVSSISIDWGDGTTPTSLAGSATSASHTYTSTGTATSQQFTITVTATDNSGATGSTSTSETVNDRPPGVTVSSVSPNPALVGQTVTVTFSATDPDGTISTFGVNWGDGSAADSLPGTATSDTHSYGSGGSFVITVTATDNSGSPGSGTSSETVSSPLAPTVNVTSVTPNPADTSATVTVTFTVSSTLPVSGITVNWGDGTTLDSFAATATSDTHVYTSTGSFKSQNFTITVSATNSAGTGSATSQETVNDQVPVVTITGVTPNPASTGVTITIGFTSTDSDGTISGIIVNWGDGTAVDSLTGSATSDTHTYASTGNFDSKSFTITVTATDNSGSTGSATATETANDRPPVVTVTNVSPNQANTGQLVTVTFASSDADGTISSTTVNWGDGSAPDVLAGSATTDTHTYSSSNTFTIIVTATDNSGSTGQGTGSVTVQTPVSPPTVSVNSPTPNPAATGQAVSITFAVSSSVTVTGVTVNWGDGTATDSLPGTATSDTHIYASTGGVKTQTFTIAVTATNSAGQGSGTTSETVSDRSPAVTISGVSPNPASTGATVTVTFSATDPDGSIVSVIVGWGDGSTPTSLSGSATSASHVYTSTGSIKSQTFTIAVSVTDNSGSTGQQTSSVTVNDRVPVVIISNISPNPANTGQLLTVTFTVTDPDGTISSISVYWGDGTVPDSLPGTVTSDTHSYTQTGTFTISVSGTDNSGSTGQATGTVTVTVPIVSPYALVVTAEGKVYRFYQNGTLTLVGQPVTTPLRQVAWKPDGSYALIAGDFAVLLKYDGTQLTTVPTGISTGYNFWSVSWKQDGTYALIGGSVGLLLKYDGISVTQITNTGGTTILSMSWHPSGSYVVLAGKSGLLRTYDGTTIRSFATPTGTSDLNTVAWNPNGQYALIGALNGVVLTFDGTTVSPVNTNGLTGTNAIKAIAFNPSGSLALLVGDNGMVLTYNGSTLTLLPNITGSWLYAVSWSPSGTAYILGGSGAILTYTNGTLAKLTSNPLTTSQFRGIAWKPN